MLIPWPRGARRALLLRELESQVASTLPAWPVLASQLQQTAQQVEASVTEVCRGFTDMAERARSTVSTAVRLLHGDGTGEDQGTRFASVIESSERTLANLLERVVKSSELSMKAVYRINDVEQAMREVERVLARIDRIALSTKIVALNAKIEAVRAGDWGVGFGVVADEITLQAEESAAVASSVRGTVVDLRKNLGEAVASLRELASRDMNDVIENKHLIEVALAELRDSHARLQASVEEAARSSEQLAADIFGAVTALQFQDRVSQRIGHVVEALGEFSTQLGETMARLEPTRPWRMAERGEATLATLQARYSMHEEHHAHRADAPAEAAADEGSVELF